ncbi:hypothetical protein U724_03510 [Pseudomonas chlororaphis subsp. aurantiaca PB-St2]|nr:hypothetical protein U724_03510 [Pseudomonas chlororaphis subsp. aurantiaca PB-St2]
MSVGKVTDLGYVFDCGNPWSLDLGRVGLFKYIGIWVAMQPIEMIFTSNLFYALWKSLFNIKINTMNDIVLA